MLSMGSMLFNVMYPLLILNFLCDWWYNLVTTVVIGNTRKQLPAHNIRLALVSVANIVPNVCINMLGIGIALGNI